MGPTHEHVRKGKQKFLLLLGKEAALVAWGEGRGGGGARGAGKGHVHLPQNATISHLPCSQRNCQPWRPRQWW